LIELKTNLIIKWKEITRLMDVEKILMFGYGSATTNEKKQFEIFKTNILQICSEKCMKRERNYNLDGEICPAKCFDMITKLYQVGLLQMNQYYTENKEIIQTKF
jgi:hypothetical protein